MNQTQAAKAIGHPIRVRIMAELNSTGGPLSPSKLSELLGESIGTTAYHVRLLAQVKAVKEVKTKQVRGAIEHYYRPLVKFGEIPIQEVKK